MGIGAQMIWPDGLIDGSSHAACRSSAPTGTSVAVHGSTTSSPLHLRHDHPGHDADEVKAAYTLWDMALDTVGLLDALELPRAHIVGASMGMIAQCRAIRHPERVESLVSIMSTTGSRRHFRPQPRAIGALLGKRPTTRPEALETFVSFSRAMAGNGFPVDEALARDIASRCWDRGNHPDGFIRQWAAILASGSRRRLLEQVTATTLVIHGSDDPLLIPDGGIATAHAVPGARMEIIEGMGHSLPRGVWPGIADLVAGHVHSTQG